MEGDFLYHQPETILEHYELEVNQIVKGRGVYICSTSQGMKQLTPFRGSKERAEFLKQMLAFLMENEYLVEQIYPTKEGEALYTDEMGSRYLLKDMFEGNECSTRSRDDMKKAMEVLAEFHRLSTNCPLEIPKFMKDEKQTFLPIYEKHYRELIKVKNYVRNRKKKNEFEMKFQEQYAHFMEDANQSIEMLKEDMPLPTDYALCHGDFNQHNVLQIKGKNKFVIINFENMSYHLPIMDVSNFLRKMLEKNNWDSELGMSLINSYSNVRTFSQKDYKQLYISLLFPEKFWKIANHYANSHKAWLSGRDIEKLEKVINQEEARSAFLQNLFSFIS